MNDQHKSTTKTARDAEGADEVLDDNTREMLGEYTRKFIALIQQEKERARKRALEESHSIIAEAERKGQQDYDKAIRDAEKESDVILARSRDLAKNLLSETERFTKTVTNLKDKVEQEIENIRYQVRQEADLIAEAIHKGEKTISDARERLQNEFEVSSRLVTELRHKLEQAARIPTSDKKPEIVQAGELAKSPMTTTDTRKEAAAVAGTKPDNESLRGSDGKPFVGTLYLDIYNADSKLCKRFEKSLSKLQDLDVSLVDNAPGGKTRMAVFLSRPQPLLRILNQMSLVKSAIGDEESIRIVLQESDQWVG